MNKEKLILEQLDSYLKKYAPLRFTNIPVKGWIRAIRDGLGMTAKQLANRLGTTQQNVARIEKDEVAGGVTIKTMKRLARGLDCTFVYGFVPNSTLKDTIRKQVELVVKQQLSNASHTMLLENQKLNNIEQNKIDKLMIKDYLDNPPSFLWDIE